MKKNLAPILTAVAVGAIILFIALAVGSTKQAPVTDAAVKDKMISYATSLGLDEATFKKDIDSSDTVAAIKKDQDLAAALNLPGTPSFFVNGVYIETKASSDLAAAVDRALQGQDPAGGVTPAIKPTDTQKAEIALGQEKGNQASNVTVTEFGDFQCPACKTYETDLQTTFFPKYLDKVRFVFKNFPLVKIHQNALISAQAAHAAGKQNKFWEMHDLLYDKQDEWNN